MTTEINVNQSEHQAAERTRTGQYYRPHVDILDQDSELLLMADMPGVKSEAIEIDFKDGVLSIEGPVEHRYPENANFMLCEFGIGDFYRTFRVSEQVDASRIHAEFSDGVLTLHLPKVEQAKPRKITVNATG